MVRGTYNKTFAYVDYRTVTSVTIFQSIKKIQNLQKYVLKRETPRSDYRYELAVTAFATSMSHPDFVYLFGDLLLPC